ncbi:MAG: ABC transporter permease [Euryarchaeota archaeon]|nr:MAG: hypothetical protein C5S47_05295 [ANME-2 cluster archaeon]MEA1864284.1 ABC transporter permease [Euryarchaeota archaeon]
MEIGLEGLIICEIGGAFGCLVSFPIARLLNALIYRAVGFDGLVAIKPEFVYVSFSLVIVMGLVATAVYVAGINRITPIDYSGGRERESNSHDRSSIPTAIKTPAPSPGLRVGFGLCAGCGVVAVAVGVSVGEVVDALETDAFDSGVASGNGTGSGRSESTYCRT